MSNLSASQPWTSRLLEERALFVSFAVSTLEHGNMARRGPGRDSEDNDVVMQRRLGFVRQMGIDDSRPIIVGVGQHRTAIVETSADMDRTPSCDILATNAPDTILWFNAADCLVIPLVDPVTHAIELVHASYENVGYGVIPTSVSHMWTRYGAHPDQLLAVLPPSWQGASGEGSWMKERGYRIADASWNPYISSGDEKGSLCLRWVDRVWDELLKCGVLESNIERAAIDTVTSGRFFSNHLYETGRQELNGRHACALAIR